MGACKAGSIASEATWVVQLLDLSKQVPKLHAALAALPFDGARCSTRWCDAIFGAHYHRTKALCSSRLPHRGRWHRGTEGTSHKRCSCAAVATSTTVALARERENAGFLLRASMHRPLGSASGSASGSGSSELGAYAAPSFNKMAAPHNDKASAMLQPDSPLERDSSIAAVRR